MKMLPTRAFTSDACGITEVTYIDVAAGNCPIVVTRTWTVKDACSNIKTCEQTINVDDNTMPTITTCPVTRNIEGCNTGAITGPAYSTTSAASSEAEFESGTNQGDASDACGITEVTYIDVAAGTCPIVVTRTWTVKDACGNIKTCDQTINVDDNTMPAITACPVTRNIEGCNTGAITGPAYSTTSAASSEAEFENATNQGVASDACGITEVTYIDVAAGNCPIVVTRTWTVKDACGNIKTCDQTINVDDTTPPSATAPGTVDIECSTAIPAPATTIAEFLALTGASASDICTAQANLTVSSTTGPLVGTECNGTIARQYMITDECGNTTTVTQTFTVTDNTAPILTPNGGDPIQLCKDVAYADPGVTAMDNCSGDVTGTVTVMGSVDITTPGSYVVTYTATDDCGNTATVTRTFVVNPNPTVTGVITNVSCHGGSNGAIDITAAGGTPGYSYNWDGPSVAIANEDQTGLPAGTFLVTVTDSKGCTVTEAFGITEPTELEASISGQTNVLCNGASTGAASVSASGGTPGYSYDWTGAPAGDGTASVTGLAAGTYTVTVTDSKSCTATASVTITQPTKLIASVVSVTHESCAGANDGAGTVTGIGGTTPYAYAWGDPSIPAFTAGAAEGTWTVTVTASLGACNDTEEFEIEINDAGGLHWVNCPADMTINNDVDKCGANVNWTPPTALDDCDDATVSGPAGGDPGDFFAVGMHTITYEATDGNGNTITCSFKITVADMQLPDAVCKDITVVLDAGTSSCALLDDDFATDPALAPGNVDGSWYPDRYPPSAFVSDAGRLKISISASDGAQLRPPGYSSAFYNTQGRKYNQCGSA
ncbi:MAG: DUF5011 domain-containing protein [Saprospirales bacterium]|nr:DUF5011 domain-containing protein [Saprospirales bacterium]